MNLPSFPVDELHKFRVIFGFFIFVFAITSSLWLLAFLDSTLQEVNKAHESYAIEYPPAEAARLVDQAAKEEKLRFSDLWRKNEFASKVTNVAPWFGLILVLVGIYGGYSMIAGFHQWSKHQDLRDRYLKAQVEYIEKEIKK